MVAIILYPESNGNVTVLLVNISQKQLPISTGGEIAQLIFEQAATPAIKLLSTLNIYSPAIKVKARSAQSPTIIKDNKSSLPHIIPPDE